MHRRLSALRAILGISVVMAAGVLTLATSPPVHAGTYKLYTCNVPGRGTPLPSTAPWTTQLDGVNTYAFNECSSGGSFGIGLNVKSMRAFAEALLILERPREGPKSAIGLIRYRTWITAELAGGGDPAFVDVGGWCGPPGCVTPDDTPWTSTPFAQDNPRVSIRLRCTAGDCSFVSARPLQVRGVEVDLYEDVPPVGAIEGGTLLAGGAISGPRTLSVSAADRESGVALVEVLLGDTVVAKQDLESSRALCPHTEFNACPATHAAQLVIDPSLVAPGEYVAAIRITDAAGNRRVVTHPQPLVIGGRAGPPEARLDASFGRSRATYTTSYGRVARVHGRLTQASGNPIAGGRIAITEETRSSTRPFAQGSVTTAADGRFVYAASGRGPSRSIRLDHVRPGGRVLSRRLRLNVRAVGTLKVSLRGITVRYSGRVLSRPIPDRGKKIFIQGRAAGGAWQRFAARRADKSGRFSGRYRLRVRRPGVRLQFRVEIPKQVGYPFLAHIGTPVTRVVR